MNEDRKLINTNLVETVRYFPKEEYEFYRVIKEGEEISSFLGLLKKKVKKDLYYFEDLETVITRNYDKPVEIDKVEEYLEKVKPDRLYLDQEDGKIYYKPFFKVRFSSGKTETFWTEDIEEAKKFIEKFENSTNFIEIELW